MSFYQQQQQPQFRQPARQPSQLWMGELDVFWDETFVRSCWAALGFPEVTVKLIRDFKTVQGQNAGYCFVEFPTLELASAALSKNGTHIPNTNRVLKLNWASGGASSGGSRGSEISIFVGDLSPEVTESTLYEFFGSKYASVSGTKIMTDQQTGQSKGYGFVRFLQEEDQQRALVEMQGAIIANRPIRVSTAVPKSRQGLPPSQGQQQVQGQQRFQPPFGQFPQQQMPQAVVPTAQQQQILGSLDAQYQPPLNQYTDPNNTTVFIGGLSSIVTEEDLRLYFQPFGDITYVKIPLGKGCGFVQYTTRASAELAIANMQGYPIGNSRVRLSWGRSNTDPKPQQYKPQQELPLLYGFQQQHQVSQMPQMGTVPGITGDYGVPQIAKSQKFTEDASEGVDQSRLNQLYLAARDGRLDAIDSTNGYLFT